eukprot:scaffold418718_cov45-Prasinocladus_malaysianus.AAC.1
MDKKDLTAKGYHSLGSLDDGVLARGPVALVDDQADDLLDGAYPFADVVVEGGGGAVEDALLLPQPGPLVGLDAARQLLRRAQHQQDLTNLIKHEREGKESSNPHIVIA